MFHIVFCGDEKYLKYIAVSMTSIVKNTIISKSLSDFLATDLSEEEFITKSLDQNATQEKYVFHIITDSISDEAKSKLKQMENELSQSFPVEIITYTLSNEDFLGQPLWKGNYLAYYRLKITHFIPPSVKKVVYLDGDTLVNCDIRELFAVDLGENIAATVNEFTPVPRTLEHRHGGEPYKIGEGYYFNTGMMLINFEQWKSHNIEEQTLKFLRTYIGRCPDQDAINVAINENLVKLPPKWNFMLHGKYPPSESITIDEPLGSTVKGTRGKLAITCTRAELMEAVENPKIIHYGRKPWVTNGFYITAAFKAYYIPHFDLWWNMVAQTPVYKNELESIKQSDRYKNEVIKNDKLEKSVHANSFPFLLFKLNRRIRPWIAKLEKPFKKIRNKIRIKKISNEHKKV